MQWVGNRYVDDTGRIVAEVEGYKPVDKLIPSFFTARYEGCEFGRYITELQAKEAVEVEYGKREKS